MDCQPYITVDEFKTSPYFCSLPDCCIPSGGTIDDVINPLIIESKIIFDSYLGYELCILPRNDYFMGDNSRAYFTEYAPVVPESGVIIEYRNSTNYYGTPTTGSIDNTLDTRLYIADKKTGNIKFSSGFKRDYEWNVKYYAGYPDTNIPSEIKTAMCMMVLNLAQRLDNMQMTNPDFTLDRINIDKSMDISYGSGKVIKNVVVKSMKELYDIPIPIMKILDRFKINKLS